MKEGNVIVDIELNDVSTDEAATENLHEIRNWNTVPPNFLRIDREALEKVVYF